jgi:hypothetical protein
MHRVLPLLVCVFACSARAAAEQEAAAAHSDATRVCQQLAQRGAAVQTAVLHAFAALPQLQQVSTALLRCDHN